MASKKGSGTTSNTKDSIGKRLGLKKIGGQSVKTSQIIIRQRGNSYHESTGTYLGKDFTIMAARDGIVLFVPKRRNKLANKKLMYVQVVPFKNENIMFSDTKNTVDSTIDSVSTPVDTETVNKKVIVKKNKKV